MTSLKATRVASKTTTRWERGLTTSTTYSSVSRFSRNLRTETVILFARSGEPAITLAFSPQTPDSDARDNIPVVEFIAYSVGWNYNVCFHKGILPDRRKRT
jgi:hypothetical protein